SLPQNEMDETFGDDRSRLAAMYTSLLPGVTGQPGFGTLDGNAFLVVPTRSGLAEFHADGRVLVPYPFSSDPSTQDNMVCNDPLLTHAAILGFAAIDHGHIALAAVGLNHEIELGVLDMHAQSCFFIKACQL